MKMIKVKDDVHKKLEEMKKGTFSDTIRDLILKDDRKSVIKEAVKEAIEEAKNG